MTGEDQEHLDLSQEEYEKAFSKDMGDWADMMAKDSQMYGYRCVDTDSIKAKPYGEVF